MSLSERAQKLMSDEERAKIVRQATEDTCKFLDNLPRKQYKDGWAEDKWEEEMKKHPLFATEISEGQEISPLVAAFQSLKYDPEYNDATELAKSHKDDGNEQFKHKRYNLAVTAYSEGLKMKSDDNHINTVLYNNRAAAYYHMGSYRKSLNDATAALELNPNHLKAILRASLCCLEIEKYDECISWCEKGLKLNDNDKTLIDLKRKAEEQKKKEEQSRLILEAEKAAEQASFDKLIKVIEKKGINVDKNQLTFESLVCDYPGSSNKVHLTDDGELVWPVMFMYPQYGISDFIPNFNENSCFYDYFNELFSYYPDWDTNKEYVPENLKVYFCDKERNVVPVDPKTPLKAAMCHPKFLVISGTLNFFITCNNHFDKMYQKHNNCKKK